MPQRSALRCLPVHKRMAVHFVRCSLRDFDLPLTEASVTALPAAVGAATGSSAPAPPSVDAVTSTKTRTQPQRHRHPHTTHHPPHKRTIKKQVYNFHSKTKTVVCEHLVVYVCMCVCCASLCVPNTWPRPHTTTTWSSLPLRQSRLVSPSASPQSHSPVGRRTVPGAWCRRGRGGGEVGRGCRGGKRG